jgi:hypothetical protein
LRKLFNKVSFLTLERNDQQQKFLTEKVSPRYVYYSTLGYYPQTRGSRVARWCHVQDGDQRMATKGVDFKESSLGHRKMGHELGKESTGSGKAMLGNGSEHFLLRMKYNKREMTRSIDSQEKNQVSSKTLESVGPVQP